MMPVTNPTTMAMVLAAYEAGQFRPFDDSDHETFSGIKGQGYTWEDTHENQWVADVVASTGPAGMDMIRFDLGYCAHDRSCHFQSFTITYHKAAKPAKIGDFRIGGRVEYRLGGLTNVGHVEALGSPSEKYPEGRVTLSMAGRPDVHAHPGQCTPLED